MTDPEKATDFRVGWYALAFVVYVAAGYFLQSIVLNWLVGPLFLLAILYVIPTVGQRLATWARTKAAK